MPNENEFWKNREERLRKILQETPNNSVVEKMLEESQLQLALQSDSNNRELKKQLKEFQKDPDLHLNKHVSKRRPVKIWGIKLSIAMFLGAITSYWISGLNGDPRQLDIGATLLWGGSFCILIFGWKTFLGLHKKDNSSTSENIQLNSKVPRRNWTEVEKRVVRERQDARCNICNESPPRWEYHHKDGDRSNNSLSNCEGLCPNCHSIKTHE